MTEKTEKLIREKIDTKLGLTEELKNSQVMATTTSDEVFSIVKEAISLYKDIEQESYKNKQ